VCYPICFCQLKRALPRLMHGVQRYVDLFGKHCDEQAIVINSHRIDVLVELNGQVAPFHQIKIQTTNQLLESTDAKHEDGYTQPPPRTSPGSRVITLFASVLSLNYRGRYTTWGMARRTGHCKRPFLSHLMI
jgi:hypothetical protein